MSWRITHVDLALQRRQVVVRRAGNRMQALALVERALGPGWCVAAICLDRVERG